MSREVEPRLPARSWRTRGPTFEAVAARAAPQFRGVLETMIGHWRELEAKARVREGTS